MNTETIKLSTTNRALQLLYIVANNITPTTKDAVADLSTIFGCITDAVIDFEKKQQIINDALKLNSEGRQAWLVRPGQDDAEVKKAIEDKLPEYHQEYDKLNADLEALKGTVVDVVLPRAPMQTIKAEIDMRLQTNGDGAPLKIAGRQTIVDLHQLMTDLEKAELEGIDLPANA